MAGMKDLFLLLGQGDGRRLAELLLERCPRHDRSWAEVQITAGMLAMLAGDGRAATSTLAEASELSARLGEWAREGWACFCLGLTETLAGEIEQGRMHRERGRAVHREVGARIGGARATPAPAPPSVFDTDHVPGPRQAT